MDEIKEAELFCKELDAVLEGKAPAAGLTDETQKDLALAAKLSGLDLSGESRVKRTLKDFFVASAPKSRFVLWDWITASRWRVGAFATACILFVFMAPLTEHYMMSHEENRGGSGANFSGGGSGHRFSSSYESGISGLTPGSTLDGSKNSDSLGMIRSNIEVSPINSANVPNKAAPSRALGKLSSGFGIARGPRSGSGGGFDALKRAAADKAVDFNRTGSAGSSLDQAASRNAENAFEGSASGGAASNIAQRKRGVGESLEFLRLKAEQDHAIEARHGEGYAPTVENEFTKVAVEPLSTFSTDVDPASYANVRRFLNKGVLPPVDAVRVEELINFFDYDYPQPPAPHPFSAIADQADCPWNPKHKLVRIGLKGRSFSKGHLPPSNIVFLIDTSGSMADENKLPLLKNAFELLVKELRPEDRVSIVTYAGTAGLALPSTPGDQRGTIIKAIEGLRAGGGTAGSAGIQLAYKTALDNFIKEGNNRVILATDGDFNVGLTSDEDLVKFIEEKRDHGVFLTVLGVGQGNYQDAKMMKLADHGNGNYSYLDNILEAQRVLVRELSATLVTLAKDVKIQVEFNPYRVQSYRLIGYEKRMLKAEDFNDDKKDAGELGAGQHVTALYEIVPAYAEEERKGVDAIKYKPKVPVPAGLPNDEMLTVKFRYKEPLGNASKLVTRVVKDYPAAFNEAPRELRFAASVAGFGMVLRDSKFKGDLTYKKVGELAHDALGPDENGDRAEFLRLVDAADKLTPKKPTPTEK